MSASAELYITIDTKEGRRVEEIVDQAASRLGYDTADGEKYQVGRYTSGLIIEAKGYSVSYDVFEEEWAEEMIRTIHKLDASAQAEVYVYNLDREADVMVSSRYLGFDEPQGCESCGNVDHKCACKSGVGRQTDVEVVK